MTTKMKNDTKFTQSEMLTALNNMKAPFSIKEQDYLESYIKRYEFFEYGQSDIESLILEILSGATDDDLEMKTISGFTPEEIDAQFPEAIPTIYDEDNYFTPRVINPINHSPIFDKDLPSNELGHITVIPKIWFPDSPYYKSLMDGTHGSFAQSLCKAWYNADRVNRKRLSEAFPDYFIANDYILF